MYKSLYFVQKRFHASKFNSLDVNNVLANQKSNQKLYDKGILNRSKQARQTIFVHFLPSNNEKLNEANALRNFYDYTTRLNLNVQNIYHFKNKSSHAALVELGSRSEVDFLLAEKCSQFHNELRLPITTRSLCYHHRVFGQKINNMKMNNKKNIGSFHKIVHLDQDVNYDFDDMKYLLDKKNNLNENFNQQLTHLYNSTKSDEFTMRLKFFIASLIEDLFSSLCKSTTCLPFGSSVNGFGKKTSDLDMQLFFEPPIYLQTIKANTNDICLQFRSKQTHANKRSQAQNYLRLIKELMETFSPDFFNTQIIATARVPILKFKYQFLSNVECDLSLSSVHQGYLMSKLLWTYCNLNPEIVQKFVYLVKLWAKRSNLCRTVSGFSSSHLNFMSLHYLMLENHVPEVKKIILNYENILAYNCTLQGKDIIKVQNEFDYEKKAIDIYSLSEIKTTHNQPTRTTDILELFKGFLKFYSNFNYDNYCIDLDLNNNPNRENRPIFIANPLMPNINAGSNLKAPVVQIFKKSCYVTLNQLINLEKQSSQFNLKSLIQSINSSDIENSMDVNVDDMDKSEEENESEFINQIIEKY